MRAATKWWFGFALSCALVLLAFPFSRPATADGKIFAPRNYAGSIEERSQEAIIVFTPSEKPGEAVQDLILRISVHGKQAAEQLGWVVPFPTQPEVAREDEKLFKELYDYVEARMAQRMSKGRNLEGAKSAVPEARPAVEVLSRKTVGSYDVAIVREQDAGGLAAWLEQEGFQPLSEDAGPTVGFYREKGYVFACMKVTEAALAAGQETDLHPLRFTFKTGGRDGIYFPMKMTGLQSEPFNVNLYVFYGKWINDKLNRFGFVHRGFRLKHRDWDTNACAPNAGKAWSAPQTDPYLRDRAQTLPQTAAFFQKRHPGERYYLTNLQAFGLKPQDVRAWSDDLWLFPHYTDTSFVPFDAREGGIASAAWPGLSAHDPDGAPMQESAGGEARGFDWTTAGTAALGVLIALALLGWLLLSRRRTANA